MIYTKLSLQSKQSSAKRNAHGNSIRAHMDTTLIGGSQSQKKKKKKNENLKK